MDANASPREGMKNYRKFENLFNFCEEILELREKSNADLGPIEANPGP